MGAAGLVVGLGVGWVLTRSAAAYIQGLQLPGALPLVGATLLLLMATVVAAFIPAARAAGIDPVVALRSN